MLFIPSFSNYFLELRVHCPRNWGRTPGRTGVVLVFMEVTGQPCLGYLGSAFPSAPFGNSLVGGKSPFCISSHSVLHVKAWPWLLLMVHTSLFYPHSQNLGLYCSFACSYLWVVLQGHSQTLARPRHSSQSVRHPFIFEGLDHTFLSHETSHGSATLTTFQVLSSTQSLIYEHRASPECM